MQQAMSLGVGIEKAQKLRMERLRLAFVASLLTIVITVLVVVAGYLPARVAATYTALVAGSAATFYALFRSGLNLRFADPTLAVPQLVVAGIAISYLVYESDVTRAVAMALYVMAFMFGMFTLGMRGLATLAAFYVACYVAAVGIQVQLRPETVELRREVVRTLVLAIVLGWLTAHGHYLHGLRRHLRLGNQRLNEALTRYQKLAEMSSDWYWEQDEKFRFTRIDGGLQGKFGVDPEQLIGQTRWDAGYDEFGADFWRDHIRTLARHEPFRDFEIVRRDAQGKVAYAALISGEPVFDEGRAFRGYRGVGRDITERKRMEETVARMAAYDELTGLPNARQLSQQLARAVAEAGRMGTRFAVLYCDLDGFKPVNDDLGHQAGDSLLREVASRLVATLREADMIARVGGDEFVALATTCRTLEEAQRFAERICRALDGPFVIGGREARISCSIGIALHPDHGARAENLLDAADRAMYAAKRAGRGRYAAAGS